ncbi:MAG: late control D family protein [Fulvimarina manganoxydans]|uniref:phage late control D family protein n=1 Tax=Fulvimarina manganoxydans TaxID=937218 RepID=UPI00235539B1|nr:late control D family protein [Fulvimarina manganoxydans]MCK5934507.1 late control D family protein [Fulvimarina manganoxydans]
MAWNDWDVSIGGTSRIGQMADYLLSIDWTDSEGVESDTCRLTFDDSDGQLALPPKRAVATVSRDGVEIYSGVVDSTPWKMTRGGGRVLEVSLKAFDTRGKAVETQNWHLDDKTLKDALEKAAQNAGVSVTVDHAFAAIERDYWNPLGESFIAFAERLRREFGATFKMRGGKEAVFAMRGTGLSPFGQALPTVIGRVPPPGEETSGNVHSIDIDPTRGRPRSKEKRVTWFDPKAGAFKDKRVTIALDDIGEAIDTQRWPAADETQGGTMASGQKTDAEQDAGVGSVMMEFTPDAFVEGRFQLIGARPGIDGTYRIASVSSKATRDSGGTTNLQLAQPNAG